MQNVVIVGGSKGIGAALAQRLDQKDDISLQIISRSQPEFTGSFKWIEADVLGEIPKLDFDRLHGLVYAPGSINLKPFHRLKAEDFKRDLDVNVHGAIKVVQQYIKLLKASKNASVVFFSTVAVKLGMPFHSSVAMSKAAIEGLTRSLAAEYGPAGLRFNCIAPSITDTPLAAQLLSDDKRKDASARRHPLGRYGTPKDLASMAEYLLSDDASWMTGQTLQIDGGMSSIKLI